MSASLNPGAVHGMTMAHAALQGPRHDPHAPIQVVLARSRDGEVGRAAFAALSSFACLAAGIWAMLAGEGSWISAVGLYFVGKAFFVGPQLMYSAR